MTAQDAKKQLIALVLAETKFEPSRVGSKTPDKSRPDWRPIIEGVYRLLRTPDGSAWPPDEAPVAPAPAPEPSLPVEDAAAVSVP